VALGSILRAEVRGRRLARFFGCTAVVAACLLIPASATAVNSLVLRGFGTATLDGAMGPGEWDPAGHHDFTVNRAPPEGGTVPATIYVMNDGANLYIALKVANAIVGRSTLEIPFGDLFTEGADNLYVNSSGIFSDRFKHEVVPNGWQTVNDTSYGGTDDGAEAEADGPGYSFYELSHPLNDADDAHDFSLGVPDRPEFNVRFVHCSSLGSCAAASYFPGPSSRDQADLVVVSGSRVPPDTRLTTGPAEGSMTAEQVPQFAFTGSDDVLQSSQLTFECKTDDDVWRACTSPPPVAVVDGRHRFSVRAIDEMLNVDQSPAQRNWSVDTTGPSKPVVRGPRSARKGRRVVLRFSARDELAGGIRFKCAVDSTRLKRCPAVFRVKLRARRHFVRVRALDRLGNPSDLSTFRIKVKRTPR